MSQEVLKIYSHHVLSRPLASFLEVTLSKLVDFSHSKVLENIQDNESTQLYNYITNVWLTSESFSFDLGIKNNHIFCMVNEMMEEVSDSTKHKTKTKSAEINIVIEAVSLVEERSSSVAQGLKGRRPQSAQTCQRYKT